MFQTKHLSCMLVNKQYSGYKVKMPELIEKCAFAIYLPLFKQRHNYIVQEFTNQTPSMKRKVREVANADT